MISVKEVMDLLGPEEITEIMDDLGAHSYRTDSQGHYIFQTICHHDDGDEGSYKLYYFPDTKLFYCFSHCGKLDLFDLVMRRKGFDDFFSAFLYVLRFFNISTEGAEVVEKVDDWDVLERVENLKKRKELRENRKIDLDTVEIVQENILELYPQGVYPHEWEKEGIAPSVMERYQIRVDSSTQSIIIPHRDESGNLVGIRRRTYDPYELQRGKYTPLTVEKTMYNHPLGDYLYGLDKNAKAIKEHDAVVVFEAEKSVMQMASFYGVDDCYGVATCGSSLSQKQVSLLLKLGINNVILAYDREFLGGRGDDDTVAYEDKLTRVMRPLLPYFKVYVVMDYDHLTGFKDSPTDLGKEVFESLLSQRIYVRN